MDPGIAKVPTESKTTMDIHVNMTIELLQKWGVVRVLFGIPSGTKNDDDENDDETTN